MTSYNNHLRTKILSKQIVKVIAGLNNFNINHIIKVSKAAELAGASYIDIAANPKIISIVRSIIDLPICVSSIDPIELYKCWLVGADIVEIGNFDIFYNKQIFFSKDAVLRLAKATSILIPVSDICITIPHTLCLHEQIELVSNLSKLGISLIQTEGVSTKFNIDNQNILTSIHNATAALSSTYTITKYNQVPVIASSGINALSAPIAISHGAHAVGIGSALRHYKDINSIANYLKEVLCSISSQRNNVLKSQSWQFDSVSIVQVQV